MEFKEKLKEYQELVNKELENYVRKYDCYEKNLNNSMEYSLMAGGKRLRAILVIDTYKLFQEDFEKCMPFSMALEIIHNFSLIHDDLPEIDNDDFRHGKPTNHKQFNHATALLAGDALLNQAYIIISKELQKDFDKSNYTDLKAKIKAFNEFSIAVDRMIAGEYLDTELENKQISKELQEDVQTFEREIRNARKQKSVTGHER